MDPNFLDDDEGGIDKFKEEYKELFGNSVQMTDEMSSIAGDTSNMDEEPTILQEDGFKQQKKGPPKKAIDEAIKNLKIMTVSMGFPEPGNLRSKNPREVSMTLKCFAAILK